jgi:hypothetical protein
MHPAVNACKKVNRMRVSAFEHKITEVTGPIKAEAMAREIIGKKHFRLKRFFSRPCDRKITSGVWRARCRLDLFSQLQGISSST